MIAMMLMVCSGEEEEEILLVRAGGQNQISKCFSFLHNLRFLFVKKIVL